jgi:hypothetical protein
LPSDGDQIGHLPIPNSMLLPGCRPRLFVPGARNMDEMPVSPVTSRDDVTGNSYADGLE